MEQVFRFVDSGLVDPALSAALDEAIARARGEGKVRDTLHFYVRRKPTVSLGYFQKVRDCIDIEECRKLGVSIVRRATGGSAIYTDGDQLIWAVITKGTPRRTLQDSFAFVCKGIVLGLRAMGLDASFKPVNDVLVGGRKVSGSAQTRRRGVTLVHGTLILDIDRSTMASVLRPLEKHRGKAAASPASHVVSLRELLGKRPSMRAVKAKMREGFSEALGVKLARGSLTGYERDLARRLEEQKYGNGEWTFAR